DEDRRDTPQGWITALEPLPGESLAKAKLHEPALQTDEPVRSALASESEKPAFPSVEHDQQIDQRDDQQKQMSADAGLAAESPRIESPVTVPSVEDHPDLTEEEATALAEHVAEAQQEEAEREAEERAEEASLDDSPENGAAENAEDNGEESDSEGEEESGEVSEVESPEQAETETEEGEANEDEEDEDSLAEEEELGPLAEISESESDAIEEKEGEEVLHEELAASAETESQPTEARVHSDFRARMQRPMRRGGRD